MISDDTPPQLRRLPIQSIGLPFLWLINIYVLLNSTDSTFEQVVTEVVGCWLLVDGWLFPTTNNHQLPTFIYCVGCGVGAAVFSPLCCKAA
jgi:hypothetical protein